MAPSPGASDDLAKRAGSEPLRGAPAAVRSRPITPLTAPPAGTAAGQPASLLQLDPHAASTDAAVTFIERLTRSTQNGSRSRVSTAPNHPDGDSSSAVPPSYTQLPYMPRMGDLHGTTAAGGGGNGGGAAATAAAAAATGMAASAATAAAGGGGTGGNATASHPPPTPPTITTTEKLEVVLPGAPVPPQQQQVGGVPPLVDTSLDAAVAPPPLEGCTLAEYATAADHWLLTDSKLEQYEECVARGLLMVRNLVRCEPRFALQPPTSLLATVRDCLGSKHGLIRAAAASALTAFAACSPGRDAIQKDPAVLSRALHMLGMGIAAGCDNLDTQYACLALANVALNASCKQPLLRLGVLSKATDLLRAVINHFNGTNANGNSHASSGSGGGGSSVGAPGGSGAAHGSNGTSNGNGNGYGYVHRLGNNPNNRHGNAGGGSGGGTSGKGTGNAGGKSGNSGGGGGGGGGVKGGPPASVIRSACFMSTLLTGLAVDAEGREQLQQSGLLDLASELYDRCSTVLGADHTLSRRLALLGEAGGAAELLEELYDGQTIGMGVPWDEDFGGSFTTRASSMGPSGLLRGVSFADNTGRPAGRAYAAMTALNKMMGTEGPSSTSGGSGVLSSHNSFVARSLSRKRSVSASTAAAAAATAALATSNNNNNISNSIPGSSPLGAGATASSPRDMPSAPSRPSRRMLSAGSQKHPQPPSASATAAAPAPPSTSPTTHAWAPIAAGPTAPALASGTATTTIMLGPSPFAQRMSALNLGESGLQTVGSGNSQAAVVGAASQQQQQSSTAMASPSSQGGSMLGVHFSAAIFQDAAAACSSQTDDDSCRCRSSTSYLASQLMAQLNAKSLRLPAVMGFGSSAIRSTCSPAVSFTEGPTGHTPSSMLSQGQGAAVLQSRHSAGLPLSHQQLTTQPPEGSGLQHSASSPCRPRSSGVSVTSGRMQELQKRLITNSKHSMLPDSSRPLSPTRPRSGSSSSPLLARTDSQTSRMDLPFHLVRSSSIASTATKGKASRVSAAYGQHAPNAQQLNRSPSRRPSLNGSAGHGHSLPRKFAPEL
ncbi:hypothetical protein Agub_g10767 [Astrephomene gubernaculifera]|uniref:Uncharacterized protein n=1 Tax=Astrephomene gubernaculifera TaxID=47775 RepID=A0AAD3HQE3_9CHLO|nr:hypothetical protein Agub_g10767 [Astrephomene gubernaculifera]